MSDKVKILVGYHKPAELLKSDVFVPIHLGRALATQVSKDGDFSQESFRWMLDNMIGDDTGENVSNLNRELCELTALYWAWKNYDKLDNPDYIGFMHYRRHLSFDENNNEQTNDCGLVNYQSLNNEYLETNFLNDKTVVDLVKKYDIVLPEICDVKRMGMPDIYQQYKFSIHHNIKDLDLAVEVLKQKYPEFSQNAAAYLNNNEGYFTNVFVMKKELFFEYCEWLFNIILPVMEKIDYSKRSIAQCRALGFVSERLFGIFFTQVIRARGLKVKELKRAFLLNTDLVLPLEKTFDDEISLIFSCDENYAPYLGVCVQSILENANKLQKYVVYVLHEKLSNVVKSKFKSMQTEFLRIKFVDINSYLANIDKTIFHINSHFTLASYFRFFIPRIFKNFDKVLYVDCDGVFMADPAELYNTNICDKLMGVVRDTAVAPETTNGEPDEYYTSILGLNNVSDYFQTGIMLMNISALLDFDFENVCLKKLCEVKTPKFVDQCIVNSVCQGKVFYIDGAWNVENHLTIFNNDLIFDLPYSVYTEYMDNLHNPKFLHFSSWMKPWAYPSIINSDKFWFFARKSLFYEEIIEKNLSVGASKKLILNPKKKFYSNFGERIFSVKNHKVEGTKYKVLTLFGIKFMRKMYKKG